MTNKSIAPIAIITILVLILGGIALNKNINAKANSSPIKIGIVTDLTGPAAYWGESTQVGAEIAKKELEAEGYKVELVYEDYQLDAAKALTSAQKLVNVDGVDAIYAEFNPAAISIGSFMKDQDKIFVYDAAVISPLADNGNAFKTYLDYQEGCKQVAEKFKNQGVKKIGVLKANLEFGELCLAGVKEVYGENTIAEAYEFGDTDVKTQILKIKNTGAGAIINAGLEGDTLNTLKVLKEIKYNIPYGTVDDSVTENVLDQYPSETKGMITFGFQDVTKGFSEKLKLESGNKELATEYAAAITYTHIKQIVKALNGNTTADASKEISNAKSDSTIGFNKFENQIADLTMKIKQY